MGGIYKNNGRLYSTMEPKSRTVSNKTAVGQRVSSAKMHRVKQLQNQLADAHYHLNELANENRLLKALQKRQDSALRRYEGTNAELPRIINSHHEELRVLQTKYKRLKALHRETCDLLKEKENELRALQVQHKHLLQLSKDKHLGEREKLQMHVSDLNHEIQRQHETIQMLQKKLAVESKSAKHHINLEVNKHRETQKHLQETMRKLKGLESLLDSKERRLYCNGQIPVYNPGKNMGSHSLTNLRDFRRDDSISSNLQNIVTTETNTHNNSLALHSPTGAKRNELINESVERPRSIQLSLRSETMTSFQQVRKFRLQKSLGGQQHSFRQPAVVGRESSNNDSSNEKSVDDAKATSFDRMEFSNGVSTRKYSFGGGQCSPELDESDEMSDENGKPKRSMYALPEELKKEFQYSSEDSEAYDNVDEEISRSNRLVAPAHRSRQLHARLIDDTNDFCDVVDDDDANGGGGSGTGSRSPVRFIKGNLDEPVYKYKSILNYFTDSARNYEDDADGRMVFSRKDIEKDRRVEMMRPLREDDGRRGGGVVDDGGRVDDLLEDLRENAKVDEGRKSLDGTERILPEEMGKNVVDHDDDDDDDDDGAEAMNSRVFHDGFKKEYSENSPIDKPEPNLLAESSESADVYHLERAKTFTAEDKEKKLNYSDSFVMTDRVFESVTTDSLEIDVLKSSLGNYASESSRAEKSTIKNSGMSGREEESINEQTNENNSTNNMQSTSDLSQQDSVRSFERKEREIMGSNKVEKVIPYNKDKLLATMKAIDDNDNIEFIDHRGLEKNNIKNRMQITENLYRGLPTHTKAKRDVIKDLFGGDIAGNKPRTSCSKLH